MTSSVKFPDINPEDLPEDAKLSMTAGDFLEVSNNVITINLKPYLRTQNIGKFLFYKMNMHSNRYTVLKDIEAQKT